ncbi:group 1 truncated hemoglobin [Shewanella mesophila]|uniref:group I truncated hemoglobin n=1 Tax=Shewanella mesophila TaxID=2864208 RepID=UPI001C65E534|nr:group 1 truncated hemoglobin [Shewanella mesophila]QYJ84671.1 group 1 truncated hemoglobin [Shewanella mesophila]
MNLIKSINCHIKQHNFLAIAIFFCLILIQTGCASNHATLYEKLGKTEGITLIADDFLTNIANDKLIRHHFEQTDIAIFRQRFIEHLCVVTGGGCNYQGETMFNSHQGLNITQADFDAIVGHLITAMKQQNMSISTRNALLAKLAPMYNDITYH